MKKLTAIMTVALLLLLSIAVYIYKRDTTELVLGDAISQLSEDTDLALQSANIREIDNQGNRWRLTAKSILYDLGKETAVLSDLHLELSPVKGEPLKIESNKGLLDSRAKTMLFWQEVQATSVTGARLKTPQLLYDGAKLTSNSAVSVMSQGVKLSGKGLEFFLGERDFKIISDVRAELGE
ncbi:MAG: LPS export ABC transporter periplasmic protein LptC [Deltaproteobacteria bacterium]|nr:LPS export ABC transporter periplasmic protein LptC [Deltaproteobacteria bacterium]